jgi:hypothetical protein
MDEGTRMHERVILRGVNVVREGRIEPFLGGDLADSSSAGKWEGIALEKCKLPAVFAPRHEHPEHFLSIVLSGTVRHEINTKGRNLRFISHPDRIILLPRGTTDQHDWAGPTERLVVAIHPRLGEMYLRLPVSGDPRCARCGSQKHSEHEAFERPRGLLNRTSKLREHVAGVRADQSDRAHRDYQDDCEHHRIFSDVLSFFIQPSLAQKVAHVSPLATLCDKCNWSRNGPDE